MSRTGVGRFDYEVSARMSVVKNIDHDGYAIQVRRSNKEDWGDYYDGWSFYENERKRWTEICASAVEHAVKYLFRSFYELHDPMHHIPTLADAHLALTLVHRINPSGFEWRIIKRSIRIKIEEVPIDHRDFVTRWAESIPYVEDQEVHNGKDPVPVDQVAGEPTGDDRAGERDPG